MNRILALIALLACFAAPARGLELLLNGVELRRGAQRQMTPDDYKTLVTDTAAQFIADWDSTSATRPINRVR